MVKQRSPFYELNLPVVLTKRNHLMEEQLNMSGETGVVEFRSPGELERLSVDPDNHVFRYLDPKEIPPSINSLKASPSVTLALGLKNYRIVSGAGSEQRDPKDDDLILIGFQKNGIPLDPSQEWMLRKDSFTIEGKTFDHPHDVFFGVFGHRETPRRFVALFHPLSLKHAKDVAKRVTHYGKYSYLAFREGHNQIKGVWPVRESPLIYDWHDSPGATNSPLMRSENHD
jgi:hypothetical protein